MKRIAMLSVLLAGSILVLGHYVLLGNASAESPVAGSPSVAAPAAGNSITIDNFSFSPATLTVPAGTTVTWTNKDDIPHTVVENGHKFKSSALDTDDKFSYTFDQPGTYDFFCSLHPKMTGRIIVEAKK